MGWRGRIWDIVEVAKPGDRVSRAFDVFILTVIVLNVLAVILESVQSIRARLSVFFVVFETVSVAVFTVEYVLRLWSCVADVRYGGPLRGRLRFAVRPMSLVDLCAILPFYVPFVGVDLRFVRVLRLLRVIRVAKLGRYNSSLRLIRNVLAAKKEELVLTTTLMLLLLITSSCLMYYCESPVQPESFPNIPATMWWAVATLTTVGYGDVYPVTVQGKLLASVISVLGIGMFALPTGILGAGFVEEIQKKKQSRRCPHCGKELGA